MHCFICVLTIYFMTPRTHIHTPQDIIDTHRALWSWQVRRLGHLHQLHFYIRTYMSLPSFYGIIIVCIHHCIYFAQLLCCHKTSAPPFPHCLHLSSQCNICFMFECAPSQNISQNIVHFARLYKEGILPSFFTFCKSFAAIKISY